MTEQHVTWFRAGGDRPVNGSGNTVYVRPHTEPATPGVLAEDLRALAEICPFDDTTIAVLERSADALDELHEMRIRTNDPLLTEEPRP